MSCSNDITAVADTRQWQQGLQGLIHYVDDHIFVEPPGLPGKALSTALAMCTALVVPVALEKAGGGACHHVYFSGHRVGLTEAVSMPARC